MATAPSTQSDSSPLRIVGKLGDAFDRMEGRIRERAYQIFKARGNGHRDPVADWLQAQLEVLTPVELVLKEQKKNVLVEGSLKGFTPEEIEVEVGAEDLRVFGSHRESGTGKKSGATESFAETRHFFQAIPLPCEVDADKCTAKLLKNGKLVVTLPKKT
ncbi:MAG: Hsp20 family protein [Halieaceae bacterium]|jgi:HSP20 family molecular chaperone IbpA|nr:Hsp20 family protein [Halieaceae bacterium]